MVVAAVVAAVVVFGTAGGLVRAGGGFQRQRDGQGEPPEVPHPGRGPSAHPLRHPARVGELSIVVVVVALGVGVALGVTAVAVRTSSLSACWVPFELLGSAAARC